MSDEPTTTPDPEDVPSNIDAPLASDFATVFHTLMDGVLEDEAAAAAGENPPADAAAGDGAGQQPPAGEGTEPAPGSDGTPPAGDGEQPAVPGDGEAAVDPNLATEGDDPEAMLDRLGKASAAIEKNASQAVQAEELSKMRTEYSKYFESIELHPRLLVGREVPKLDGTDGMETLKDSTDAKEWQEAAKGLLQQQLRTRTEERVAENAGGMRLLHASIDLFRNNKDLIPGTKGFNKALAEQFTVAAKPYENRDESGKMLGYTIPVQPMIDQMRAALKAQQSAPPVTPPPAEPPPPAPQAGLSSKAGGTGDGTTDEVDSLLGTFSRITGI